VDSSNAKGTKVGLARELRRWIRDVVRVADRELGDLRGEVRFAIRGLQMAVFVPRELVKDNCMRLAASLAYTTLMTLVPTFYIAFVLLGSVGALEGTASNVQDVLFSHLLPESAAGVRQWFDTYAQNIDKGTVSIVSATVLVLIAVSLLTTVERALNRIWNADQSRPFVTRVAIYWSTLTLGPVLMGLSIYLSAQLKVSTTLEQVRLPFFQATGASLLPVVCTWLAFTVIYLLLPNIRVKWRAAILGGVVAGTAWEVSKHGFNFYVTHFVSYTKIYGTLGLLPIFLVWLYLSWLVFLFGAELCYVTQNAESIAAIRRAAKQAAPISARLAVAVVGSVCRRFLGAQPPPTPEEIAAETGFFPAPVARVSRALVDAGFLAGLEGDNMRLVPAVAPNQLPVRKVIDWANKIGVFSAETLSGADSPCVSYDQIVAAAVNDVTFATLADRTNGAPSEE